MRLGELLAPAPSRRWRRFGLPAPVAEAATRGEVAEILRGLPEGWFVFNEIPAAASGSMIDHLVVGPGGAFAVTVADLGGQVRLAGRSLTVDGVASARLSKAVLEARSVARALEAAGGRPVGVRPVVVVRCADLSIVSAPPDVTVLRPGSILRWLRTHPPVLSRATVAAVARAAARPAAHAGSRSGSHARGASQQ
ncbi:MAG TPA: nuclease-related domain-containing protein [Actinomycetota bacterium]|nr:nuclease-related domain-containing protein [Actinomycetota bacterium]